MFARQMEGKGMKIKEALTDLVCYENCKKFGMAAFGASGKR
jgi:hypothetical protein